MDGGHAHIVAWALDQGCPFSVHDWLRAYKRVPLLALLLERGDVKVPPNLTVDAVTGGLHAVRYLVERGHPWDPHEVMYKADVLHKKDIVQWTKKYTCKT